MSNTSHTPGPWFVLEDNKPNTFFVGNDADENQFCIAGGLNEANARLIAAAPELLEALKILREDMRMLRDGAWVPDGSGTSEQASIDIADAAIARATGKE